jgi:hypothetical protein
MAKSGQVGRLEAVILAGQGRLVASLGKAWNEEVRTVIKKIPAIQVFYFFNRNSRLFSKYHQHFLVRRAAGVEIK